ncbi:MAG TPA: hypothetical protein VHG92_06505 [Afifellaceae bacterium]|nr:hypothetical protein [Afifellaceae bacterium]
MTETANQTFTTRDILARAAAFVVLTAASTALMALPYLGTAQSAPEESAGHASRLQVAFQLADEMPDQTRLRNALSAAARKTDRLASAEDCDAQTWPWIAPRCLGTEEPGVSRPFRTVTVEYRLGESGSALVRLPIRQLASQP